MQRKNAEEVATLVDVERQVIQDFIGIVPWDHRPWVTVLVGQGGKRLGEPEGLIAFDPSSFPKRGTHSVGVKRQWCGHRGKVDNCQAGVFMGYVSGHDHALLDFRLFLPGEWTRDECRRQACHVPPDLRHQTRQEQCLERLEAWGDQVPHGWVTGDDEPGRHTRLHQELRGRGERSALGAPCTTTIRDLEALLPEYSGRGRRPKAPWQSVTQWRQSLPANTWIHLTVRDGEKGPVNGAAGMDAYQVRTWQGWHHHMALSLLAVWFLVGETHRGKSLTPALTLPQVRDGLSLLLLAVWCQLGVDSICRRVQRQLQRNESARLYHHRARKCIPLRKLRL